MTPRRGLRRPSPAAAPSRAAPGGRTELTIALGLAAAVALVYAPVRAFGWIPLDDPLYVTANPRVLAGLTGEGIRWAFTSGYAANWHPLTWLSFMSEIEIFGSRPDVMHLTNVLLHAASTLLLFAWLRRATGAVWRSACVAALFALHPLHVESVAWITERKDTLSTCFWMLTLWTYTRYVDERRRGRYALTLVCFALGLMAKPMLVTLPFVMLLVDVWPLARVRSGDGAARSRWGALIVEKLPFFALALVSSVITFAVQRRGGAMITSQIFPFALRAENAAVSAVLYLWQTLWPVNLIVWYPYPESIPWWHAVLAAALLAAVTIAAVRARRRRPYLLVGWLWYLGTLVPVSGLVQVGLQPRADRYTYVPLVGIFIAAVWGIHGMFTATQRARVAEWLLASGAVLSLGVVGVVARHQVEYWRDGTTLWTHASDVTSGAGGAQAQLELGRALVQAGQTSDALAHLREAIRDKPDWAGAHGALGMVLQRAGQTPDALAEYETALRLDPGQADVQTNLAVILAGTGHMDTALPHFEAAARLTPDSDSAHANLGVALLRLGRRDEATHEFRVALQINPSNAVALQMTRGR